MKEKLIKAYMKTAQTFAECSTARRLHVGAIVVKDDRIISIGYNGMPSGWDNNCEDELKWPNGDIKFLETKPEVLHAESNAISKLARSSESGEGSTMFITHSPCLACSKLIYQSGIKKVYFGQAYRDSSGIEFLAKCKIDVEQINV
ncbi:MAG: tRNA-specific adenosine deaminase [Bacteroidota bacterium]|jgi:dCMP deaminase